MSEKTKVVINRGPREIHTTKGVLRPGESIELSENEADSLLDYRDMVDAAKVVPQTADVIEKLRAENAELKAELKALKDQGQDKKSEETPEKKKKKGR